MKKANRAVMYHYKKDQCVFKNTAVKTKAVNVKPYPARGGYRM